MPKYCLGLTAEGTSSHHPAAQLPSQKPFMVSRVVFLSESGCEACQDVSRCPHHSNPRECPEGPGATGASWDISEARQVRSKFKIHLTW
ncbi:hypothetical protein AAFF_G00049060 [Aldrovandia affinis]|uniref:Uncharacterized protein n=1 Tax=Aldrovandia affinis TaxID=143900 RepID=A0AAD7S3M4_9TELE|nr:hypothetical protein AAFF_G00049060 [Aldrovandia affinis]